MRFLSKLISNAGVKTCAFWVCVISISFLGGYVGSSIADNFSFTRSAEQAIRPTIVQDRARNTEQTATSLDAIFQSMQSSMFALYDSKGMSKTVTADTLPPDASLRGYALALTSDGWLVTTYPMHVGDKTIKIVSSRGKQYEATSLVSDPLSGLSFIKISEERLQPIDFPAFNDEDFLGDGYLVSGWRDLSRILIEAPSYQKTQSSHDYVRTTKKLSKLIRTDESFPLYCMPLVGPRNQILGCTRQTGIAPFKYLHHSLDSILHTGSFKQGTLSFSYIDLATTPVQLTDAPELRVGAYLITPKGGISMKQTEGSTAILQMGDVIVRVNGDTIDVKHDLSELLSQYDRGARLTLTVLSHGKEKDYHITLN